ncbi:MAG: DUF4038 domain-containing protein [Planctomycetes bacterium]|nr:DUF4038 domain-containing protein [Planctomycetota bacterium]
MKNRLRVLIVILCGSVPAVGGTGLVRFGEPWTSPYRVDPNRPFQVVNAEGRHLFLVNKTAWLYFGCKQPEAVLDRAVAQGVNVLRVSLEGQYYYETVGIELWPWGGTRNNPVWTQFNEAYWSEVERRIRLAGERGIGFDVTLYCTLQPTADQIDAQRAYWSCALQRLGKYANILTWEIANEYLGNEAFQRAVGEYFRANDPYGRPVCTSDGTTDDAAWPDRTWIDLAINHTCTSSSAKHDLRDWYLALARNTRSHGKPAWCNESGRENRHGNNDGVHRRKQGWLWCAAGCFWTYHSWDGCEGIDDVSYRGPGAEFLKPMAEFFRALPFWELNPNYTALTPGQVVPTRGAALEASELDLVWATLAHPDRSVVAMYLGTRVTGQAVKGGTAQLRLPKGDYRITFQRPADLETLGTLDLSASGLGAVATIALPDFTDDLVVTVKRPQAAIRTRIPGTQ